MFNKVFSICFVLVVTSGLALSQTNFNLILEGNLPASEGSNDVWGFTGSDGKEYAVLGTRQATKIIDISDGANPVMLDSIAGTLTTWRDIKTFNDHIYVTTDGNVNDGLLIINAKNIPNELDYKYVNVPIPITDGLFDTIDTIRSCHNLYIDEKGYAYLAGCNVGNQGVIILDLNKDPWNPEFVGIADREYAHDVYVQDDMMYTSEIFLGEFSIYDISDRSNPIYINGQKTSLEFTHNAWVSDDGNYIFTTDERKRSFIDAYDISNPLDIKKLDVFQPENAMRDSIIVHNTHYIEGFLVTSWYSNGVVIVDANKPDNLVMVASYDTYLENESGFRGCWGAFPFLESGRVLASDRSNGLFIFTPTYTRASYLEGKATDKESGSIITNVKVEFIDQTINDKFTNGFGNYKTGIGIEGNYSVRFSHPEYFDLIVSDIELKTGEVTILNIELERNTSNIFDVQDYNLHIGPNPFDNNVHFSWTGNLKSASIYSIDGILIQQVDLTNKNDVLIEDLGDHKALILQLTDQKGNHYSRMLIK